MFVVSTSFWTLFYIAQEIDQPFGEDANDLPVRDMQKESLPSREVTVAQGPCHPFGLQVFFCPLENQTR